MFAVRCGSIRDIVIIIDTIESSLTGSGPIRPRFFAMDDDVILCLFHFEGEYISFVPPDGVINIISDTLEAEGLTFTFEARESSFGDGFDAVNTAE